MAEFLVGDQLTRGAHHERDTNVRAIRYPYTRTPSSLHGSTKTQRLWLKLGHEVAEPLTRLKTWRRGQRPQLRRRVSIRRPLGERENRQGKARQRVDPEVVRSRPSSAQPHASHVADGNHGRVALALAAAEDRTRTEVVACPELQRWESNSRG